jgi:hypothetical protein
MRFHLNAHPISTVRQQNQSHVNKQCIPFIHFSADGASSMTVSFIVSIYPNAVTVYHLKTVLMNYFLQVATNRMRHLKENRYHNLVPELLIFSFCLIHHHLKMYHLFFVLMCENCVDEDGSVRRSPSVPSRTQSAQEEGS